MPKFSVLFFLFAVFFISADAYGQKQLVLLKGEKVVLRLYPGDEINFSLKGNKKVIRSYINNIFDTAFVAHHDVIPFYKIDRIYFKQGNYLNVIGGLMVTGGIGYFLIDQFNVIVVQGEKADLNDRVMISSATLVGIGLPLMLIKKKSQQVGRKYRLRMVEKGSAFYKPDLRQDFSGYPDN